MTSTVLHLLSMALWLGGLTALLISLRRTTTPLPAAVAARFSRVASVFASVIHSIYSRRWEGEKPSKVACAFLFFFRAAASSGGTPTIGRPADILEARPAPQAG